MKRREFIKQSIAAGLTTSAGLGYPSKLLAESNERPDLVGIMGGKPDIMFDKGIAAFGGIGQFVKPNSTVVIKPNIGWDSVPERGANTNPLLVKQITKRCIEAGAKRVYVFDHTADVWNKCYKNSGIEAATREAGGTIVPGNSEHHYHPVDIIGGRSLKSAYAHELFLEADVFINVPVLKHHIATKLSIGMKNLMGVVWDRGWWHSNNLHQCVADFAGYRKPDLTIVDAFNVMKRNGPLGISLADVVNMKAQIITTDPVAGDTAAAKFFGMNPAQVDYIRMANDLGVGTMDLSRLSIRRIKV